MPISSQRPIVVHSHLRWSGIWQRPQQIHSRIARERAVTFIEEPVAREGASRLTIEEPSPGLVVVRPEVSASLARDAAAAERAVARLLRDAAGGGLATRVRNAVHWLYTPMMEPQIAALGEPAAVVYDCMDELTQFLHAPRALRERERRLLATADVVFTGGAALYDAKRRHHDDVHLFGCGVDFEHFHRAARIEPHPDVRGIPSPRLGYVGAIDERLDYDLLASIAREHPEWSLVLVGPVVKVDPAVLPQGPNVYLLGTRQYDELPSLIAGFDVCLMPFALNEATEFINPTKTLEYLATGRPVVSTPVPDVVRLFDDVVSIAPARDFIATVAERLEHGSPARDAGLERARRATWDSIVASMQTLVQRAVDRNRIVTRRGSLDASREPDQSVADGAVRVRA